MQIIIDTSAIEQTYGFAFFFCLRVYMYVGQIRKWHFPQKMVLTYSFMAPSHGAGYVPMLMLVVVWLSKGVYKWETDLFKSILG